MMTDTHLNLNKTASSPALPPPPPPPPPPAPGPAGLLPPGMAMPGKKTDLETLQDTSLSTEARKKLFIQLIEQEKKTMDTWIAQEVELSLKMDDSPDNEDDLKKARGKIQSIQRNISTLSRTYSKITAKNADLEDAIKKGKGDLSQIQASVDESSRLIDSVREALRATFQDDDSQTTEEQLHKMLSDTREELKVILKDIEETNRHSFNASEALHSIKCARDVQTHPNRLSTLTSVENSVVTAQEKAQSFSQSLETEKRRLRESLSQKIRSLRTKIAKDTMSSALQCGPSSLNQMLKTAQTKTEKKFTTPKAKASTENTSSPREAALIAFIARGLTRPNCEESLEAPTRQILLERLHNKLTNIGVANLIHIRCTQPQMFSCEPFDTTAIVEEFSEKLLNYCVPPSIGGPDSKIKLATKTPLRAGCEFVEIIESLTAQDFITGEPISPETLESYYPSIKPLFFTTKLFTPKNLRATPQGNSDTKNNNNLGVRP